MFLVGKYARVVLLIGLVMGTVVVWAVSARDFDLARAERVSALQKPDLWQALLPAFVSQRDSEQLERQLGVLLEQPAVRYAVALDGAGDVLASLVRDPGADPSLPMLSGLRTGVPALAVGQRARALPAPFNEPRGWLSQLFPSLARGKVSDVTVPIISPVNPLEGIITSEALLASWAAPEAPGSVFVVGYIALGIDHGDLWQSLRDDIALTILYCVIALSLATALAGFYGRHLFGSLSELVESAREAVSKKLNTDIEFRAKGEAAHIAVLLNTAFAELKRYRANLNVDRELLNLKVEEQGSVITEREQQLTEARTEVTRTREDLHKMAYYDSLTGLPNRRFFNEQLNLLLKICRREESILALMFIDLDNFKRINDSLGHSAGDLLLREVSARLANCTRTSDLLGHFTDRHISVEVSRLGGDEFTVVANNLKDPEEAANVAKRALKALGAPMTIDGHELIVTPSIGIAIGPRDGKDVESLVRAADTAMYQAKTTGKNNYVYYTDEMSTTNMERLQLESDLRKAVEREELMLHYQPMVSLATGSVVGVEALVRWLHPQRGMVSPGEFIPLAEEMGLTLEIGEWTLRTACQTVAAMHKEGHRLTKVSVNISPIAISRSFAERVNNILNSTGVDPKHIELEITENVLMETDAASIESLRQLKKLGVSLSIDDFGTGYSSLSYLSHFPLDTLKIDGSFVQDFDKSANNKSLVEAIAAMGASLDLRVIAEGVETSEQLMFLRGLKLDIIQGYLFSRPVTAPKLPFILEKGYFRPKITQAMIVDTSGLKLDPA
ncbi:MAG: EAL domain-containing protein [Pseudomonadota bacterium]